MRSLYSVCCGLLDFFALEAFHTEDLRGEELELVSEYGKLQFISVRLILRNPLSWYNISA